MKTPVILLLSAAFLLLVSFTFIIPDKHIGLWRGVDQGEVGYINLDTSGYAFFIIENDTLGGRSFEMEGMEAYMKYEIDYSASPKTLDFILYIAENDVQLGRLPGIFKFDEDDHLALCVNFNGEERPTEFLEDNTIVLEKVEAVVEKDK